MNDKLALFGGLKTIHQAGPHYVWPRITDEVKAAILTQLDQGEISIYNRAGVFQNFEDAFVSYHGGLQPYALVQNSGTSALWSMYVGSGLRPGDEVIVPAYTFYATYSPLMMTGAKPIFIDSGTDGNIDPKQIEQALTSQTRAVVVTHMWGIPCDMPTIRNICDKHGLLLFEDCSHAHGASMNGQKVGTWGDAAVWSLQGQKIVTGGEGGILLTRNKELFYRALLLGQYNKRCKQQIPTDHPLYRFALTGFGLKLRAHPFAIAMALEQFGHLDTWIQQKHKYATQITEALSGYSFVKTPNYHGQPAWYAYVFQFDETIAGVSVDKFEQALLAEGLIEVDRPGSTCLNNALPLFTQPNEVLPQLYARPLGNQGGFPVAETFYRQAIKLPVWAFPDEQPWIDQYIEGLRKVSDTVSNQPSLFK